MTAIEVLQELHERQVVVEPRPGGQLALAPVEALDPALIAKVRAVKSELLKILSAHTLIDREKDEMDGVARADDWQPSAKIPAAIATEIARIEVRAISLGWDRGRLWNFAFWPHRGNEPRGLASVMDSGDRVVEVFADHLVIEKNDTGEARQRFWKCQS
jgi:hypothetical protein